MPTYRYACPDCGPFEAQGRMADFAAPRPCPACGADAPRALALPMLAGGSAPAAAAPGPAPKAHRAGCGCCTPAMKPGTAAAAATLGAPRGRAAPAAGSFLARA